MDKNNGKYDSMLSQFVKRKEEWIGGILEDHVMGIIGETKITDITLKPNGDDSAYFTVDGEHFQDMMDKRGE